LKTQEATGGRFRGCIFSVLIQYVHCTCKEAETIVTPTVASNQVKPDT